VLRSTSAYFHPSGGFLGDILGPIYAENEEWGLANVLLFEHLQVQEITYT
jgi:hypothetical protein